MMKATKIHVQYNVFTYEITNLSEQKPDDIREVKHDRVPVLRLQHTEHSFSFLSEI